MDDNRTSLRISLIEDTSKESYPDMTWKLLVVPVCSKSWIMAAIKMAKISKSVNQLCCCNKNWSQDPSKWCSINEMSVERSLNPAERKINAMRFSITKRLPRLTWWWCLCPPENRSWESRVQNTYLKKPPQEERVDCNSTEIDWRKEEGTERVGHFLVKEKEETQLWRKK